jgi:quercetin dioxygenase-like cupin family protein
MSIKDLHTRENPVSAAVLFKNECGNATAIQIIKGGKLKEHVTKTPALLLCLEGEVVFENEMGEKKVLYPGDYINIEPMVKHWVEGISESQLVLMK